MHVRSLRLITRTIAVATLGAATAPISLAPVFADELPAADPVVTVVDCDDPTLADQVEAARAAALAAKKEFTDLRGPVAREVREQRKEARAEARQARKELRAATRGPMSAEDRAAAKAARADLRAAQKTLRASHKEAVRALQAERRATKAAWDEAKDAYHDLRDAAEACEADDVDDVDETEGTEDTEVVDETEGTDPA